MKSDHPTVLAFYRQGQAEQTSQPPKELDATWLRQLCLDAGADDVGFAEIDRPELADQYEDITAFFPQTKTLLSFVCRMNREPIRSTARSVSNVEFHQTGEHVNQTAHRIVAALESRGVRAVNPAMGFPMEMARFPGGKVWVVSHKPIAVAAGLGHMGIHRNLIHPRFGNFVLIGTVLLDREVTHYHHPVDYNPCVECKLCVAACPVGAIGSDGAFNFSTCYTHNYREFMGGFTDWVETIIESRSAADYRRKVSGPESASMWQSLSFGANYKSAYCMAVCPAGEEVIAPFMIDRKKYLNQVVRPLQEKKEIVYVTPGSDAEDYVAKHFPQKTVKRVGNGLNRLTSVKSFLGALPRVFQRQRAKGLDATYHFRFTGDESVQATVIIRDQTVKVIDGLNERPDLSVTADSATWLGLLAKEKNIFWAIVRRKVRISGSPRLLLAFGKCFPS